MDEEFQSHLESRLSEALLEITRPFAEANIENDQLYIDENDRMFNDISHVDKQYSERCRQLKEEVEKMRIKNENIKQDLYEKQNKEKMLESELVVFKNRDKEVSPKPCNEDSLTELRTTVCKLREGVENEKNKVKLHVASFQKGSKFYKEYMLCNVIVVSKETVMFTLNPEAKTAAEAKEFITFNVEDKATMFEYVDMSPKLDNSAAWIKSFQETGDVQAFIVTFWRAVLQSKKTKLLSERN